MTEEPVIIRMNIAHYGEMLKLDLGDENRSVPEGLLAEAKEHLVQAAAARNCSSIATFQLHQSTV